MKRKILITGVSGNLGKAVAERYLLSGDTVIGVYSPGKTMVAGDIVPYEANLEDEAAATTAFAKIVAEQNRLDIAILTVGGFAQGNMEDTTWSAVQRMIDLNLKTCYHMARQAFAHMKTAGGGRIVLIGAKPALDGNEGIGLVAYVLGKSLVFKLAELLNAEGKSTILCAA
ncbi:MAG: SDR family oxidoreductase [Bacteroidia bacterium]|nr:SDR family oxidoreductase [Bacteroidia bacterium]